MRVCWNGRTAMNIAEIVQDAVKGRARRRVNRVYGPADPSPPAEFLERMVWPVLKDARVVLESRGYNTIATRPGRNDPAHVHSLLILDSSCPTVREACFLRFLIVEHKICVSMKHPGRSDNEPVPLDPPGSVLRIQELIEEFVYQCLARQPAKSETGSPGTETGRPETL